MSRKGAWFVVVSLFLALGTFGKDKDKAIIAFDQAYDFLQKGSFIEAKASYEEALSYAPGNLEILKEYAICLRKLGYLERSAKLGWISIEKDGSDSALWNNLGNTFMEAHAWDATMEAYLKVEKLNKDKVWVAKNFINLGYEQYNCGDYDKAIESYKHALAVNDGDGLATIGLGAATCASGDKEKGKAAIKAGQLMSSLNKSQHPAGDLRMFAGVMQSEDCTMKWSAWTSHTLLPPPFLRQPQPGQASNLAIDSLVTRRYLMPDLSYIALETPEQWSETVSAEPPSLFTITYRPEKSSAYEMMMSAVKASTPSDDLQAIANTMAKIQLKSALEKEVQLQTITSSSSTGYAFLLTDQKYAEQAPPAGEYKYALTAVQSTGKYIVVTTCLTNSKEETALAEFFKCMKSIASIK